MNASETPPKNLVLVGFMGSGKSTIGRELHQRLGYPLVDMDTAIEQRAGMSIREIFEAEGEPAFRERESALLDELIAEGGRRIVSTGGGVVVRERNRPLLRRLGFVVWLDAPAAAILDRTSRNRDRPLLHGENPEEKIRTLLAERTPWYREAAHLRIDTEGLDFDEITTGILESARYFFTGHDA